MINKRVVLIGIQARSTSKRLPNKIHMKVDGKTVLEHVTTACMNTVRYLRNDCRNLNAEIQTCLLTPKDDPVVARYKNLMTVIEGDENDVLSRYVTAAKRYNANYVVRITADCIFIPTHLIAKHIKSALIKEMDYTTNCLIRSYREGYDCEVLSRRLLDWLDKNAVDEQREHVTSAISLSEPFPFKDHYGNDSICHVLNLHDESHEKTSIDTQEDLDRATKVFTTFEEKIRLAAKNGKFVI